MTQQLTILGSTGSIGVNTLDVVARHPDQFQIFALTGARQVDLMFQQCVAFKPLFAVMVQADAARALADKIQAAATSVSSFHFKLFIKSKSSILLPPISLGCTS